MSVVTAAAVRVAVMLRFEIRTRFDERSVRGSKPYQCARLERAASRDLTGFPGAVPPVHTNQEVSRHSCFSIYSEHTETMPAIDATAAESTTLTTARQSSELLKLLRSVLQGSIRDMRRYLARGGDPHARVYKTLEWILYVSSAEHTGPGAVEAISLLAACCAYMRSAQATALLDAGADPNCDAGTTFSPMCAAAYQGDISMMETLKAKGAGVDCEGYTPLMSACVAGRLGAVNG